MLSKLYIFIIIILSAQYLSNATDYGIASQKFIQSDDGRLLKLDSIASYYWNKNKAAFVNTYQDNFRYDNNNNVTQYYHTTFDLKSDSIYTDSKSEVVFDKKNRVISKISYLLMEGYNTIYRTLKEDIVYNEQNQISDYITYKYHSYYGWEANQKVNYDYNENGQVTEARVYIPISFLDTWQIKHIFTSLYDEKGNIISEHGVKWDSFQSTFLDFTNSEYQYDEHGNLIFYLFKIFDFDKNEYYDYSKYIYRYNDLNQITYSEIYATNLLDNKFGASSKNEYVYSELGDTLAIYDYKTTENHSGFILQYKSEYMLTYDNQNTIRDISKFIYDNVLDTLLPYEKLRKIYNPKGVLIYSSTDSWDIATLDWKHQSLTEYRYNEDGSLDFMMTDNDYAGLVKSEYVYDGIGNVMHTHKNKWDSVNQDWVFYTKLDYSYDLFTKASSIIPFTIKGDSSHSIALHDQTNVLKKVDFYMDGVAMDSTGLVSYTLYHYSEVNPNSIEDSPILSNQDISIYPNPAGDMLNIHSESVNIGSEIRVYNQLGEIMYKTTQTSEMVSIPLDGYSSGIYMIQSGQKGESINKFIKK